jgi:hypothetical protein
LDVILERIINKLESLTDEGNVLKDLNELHDQINNNNLDESYKNVLKDQMSELDEMKD